MAPLHESDVAENRWKESEWRNFVLWEKLEVRFKRKKNWILAIFLFLSLSILAVPTVRDRYPKWLGEGIARKIAETVLEVRLESSIRHSAVMIQLEKRGDEIWVKAETLRDCRSTIGRELLKEWNVAQARSGRRFAVLTQEQGVQVAIPQVTTEICYDPEKGFHSRGDGLETSVFAIAPVKDLATERLDRWSVVRIGTHSGEVSFQ